MNLTTERWPRLLGSLAISVVVHWMILSTTGLATFGLSRHTAGSNRGRLVAILLPPALSSSPARSGEMTGREQLPAEVPTIIPDASAVRPRQAESTPKPIAETIDKLPPAVDSAQAAGLLPGPWYYPARYLHRRPTPLKPIYPAYPVAEENTPGQVVLLLLVNERGTVDSYQVMESQPAGRFDDVVIKAFAHETYAPGLITNYPVKAQLLVDVRFEPGRLPTANILSELAPLVDGQAKPVLSVTGNSHSQSRPPAAPPLQRLAPAAGQ